MSDKAQLIVKSAHEFHGRYFSQKNGKDLENGEFNLKWENVFDDDIICDVIIAIVRNKVVSVINIKGEQLLPEKYR